MNVLSLFDGISCGRVALEKANIKVDKYYASEIDRSSIIVSKDNYSDIIQLGDITNWKNWDIDWKTIDLVIGGSPCQGFSVAGRNLNFGDDRSNLVFDFIDIVEWVLKINPNCKFLLENVIMKESSRNIISKGLGCEPIKINSVNFTGLVRKRYYWTNIKVDTDYEKREIFLKDVVDTTLPYDIDLTIKLDRSIYNPRTSRDKIITINPKKINSLQTIQRDRIYDIKGKCPNICATLFDLLITKDHKFGRKLSIQECEKFQGLPTDYTKSIPYTKRGFCVGNGWTVDVISYIFSFLKDTSIKEIVSKPINVLSLFDGISCGRVALERANIKVDKYYASEIDNYAIKISKINYPDIIQLGDITKIDFNDYLDCDLIIGGSPCQDLSNYKYDRGEVTGLEGSKSSLFYYYVNAIRTIKPKYFLLENVASMQKKWADVISEELGVEPIMINSSLVCAAERKRLYWTNIPNIIQPIDKNIMLKDICLAKDEVPLRYWYTGKYDHIYNGDDCKVQCTLLLNSHRQAKEVYNLNGKCNTLLCDGSGGNLAKKVYQEGECRKLTPLEYERLQTLPDYYTKDVSDSRRYTAIGNGWTVDIIAHILKNIEE